MTEYPTKACIKCGDEKELNQFYRNKRSVDGYVNVCIKCKVVSHEKRKSRPSEISILMQQWVNATNRSNYATQLPQYNRQYGR